MSTSAVTVEKIRGLILKVNEGAAEFLVDDQVNLFDTGVLDSFLVLMLVQTMEEELKIIFNYDDLKATNFQNIAAIRLLLSTNYGL